jgi:hypothetical protein
MIFLDQSINRPLVIIQHSSFKFQSSEWHLSFVICHLFCHSWHSTFVYALTHAETLLPLPGLTRMHQMINLVRKLTFGCNCVSCLWGNKHIVMTVQFSVSLFRDW